MYVAENRATVHTKKKAWSLWTRLLCNVQRAGDRTRTGDVQLGKLAFYQLNYARDYRASYR